MEKVDKPTSKHISPSEGYFEITGVEWKGKPHTYRLYDKMTDLMNQDKLAEFSRREKEKGNPYAIGSPQFIAICDSAVKSGNEDLMNHIHSDLRKCPNTLSRVIYNPLPLRDKSVHEYGMPDEYSLTGKIIGRDCWIKDIENKKSLEFLAGTADIEKLNEISQGINHTPMYLWRVNSRPSKREERVVWFNANDGGLNLNANRNPLIEYPAFRVLQVD